MNDSKKAVQKLELAIQGITEEIMQNNNKNLPFTTREQLEKFKAVLCATLDRITLDCIPRQSERDLGLERIITDQWPYDFILGIKIVEAEQAYKSL